MNLKPKRSVNKKPKEMKRFKIDYSNYTSFYVLLFIKSKIF